MRDGDGGAMARIRAFKFLQVWIRPGPFPGLRVSGRNLSLPRPVNLTFQMRRHCGSNHDGQGLVDGVPLVLGGCEAGSRTPWEEETQSAASFDCQPGGTLPSSAITMNRMLFVLERPRADSHRGAGACDCCPRTNA